VSSTNETSHRSVVLQPGPFNGVKVFSATMHAQRDALGDVITAWIGAHPRYELRELIVSQSSDAAFHCYSMTVLYWEAGGRPRNHA
jgi:hypothetical protein